MLQKKFICEGFNDAGSSPKSTTRVIHLNRQRRKEAAAIFFGLANVPTRALTMGISSILAAKRIFFAAFSEGKGPFFFAQSFRVSVISVLELTPF